MNLAPNGKPSNLTPEQYALVRTLAFKKWFGDWENSPETSSKVVDFNGEPLVVYHGTERPDAILISGVFIPYGSELKELYFTNNINTALSYTYDSEAGFDEEDEEEGFNTKENIDNVIKVFLNIKNPKVKDFKGKTFTDFWNIKKDNDGNILANVYDVLSIDENLKRKDYLGNTYIVYKSEQIKLADGTNTTFDSNNPDIRYAEGGLANIKKLYRGTNTEEHDTRRFTWFSENKDFAKGFGDILIDKEINVGRVFDSTNEKQVQLLIDNNFNLYNEYDDTYFETAKEASNYSDTWDFIENSVGVINFIDSIGYDSIKILEGGSNVNYILIKKYAEGGSIPDLLSSQEVEDKLGRELHWWNDDIVYLSGIKYKKVYLRPEYKKVI